MLIPYTFIAGTKAKAEEVNANFKAVQKSVDANEKAIANVENEVETKANISGDINNPFKVANATNTYEAVNLGQVNSITSIFKSLIEGFNFTAVETLIMITEGRCYDSLGKTIIDAGSSSLNVGTYPFGTEYYIYVVNTGAGTLSSFEISTDSSNPGLPGTSTVYRKIGKFKKATDDTFEYVSMIGTRISKDEVINVKLQ